MLRTFPSIYIILYFILVFFFLTYITLNFFTEIKLNEVLMYLKIILPTCYCFIKYDLHNFNKQYFLLKCFNNETIKIKYKEKIYMYVKCMHYYLYCTMIQHYYSRVKTNILIYVCTINIKYTLEN